MIFVLSGELTTPSNVILSLIQGLESVDSNTGLVAFNTCEKGLTRNFGRVDGVGHFLLRDFI